MVAPVCAVYVVLTYSLCFYTSYVTQAQSRTIFTYVQKKMHGSCSQEESFIK